MLTIHDRGFDRNCQGRSRREFLRVGGLGLAGLTLADLMALKAQAGDSTEHKSVVFLFLSGGPTQLETWDPKPDAPVEYRTNVNTIPTALPGVGFSEYFPKMAAAAKDLAIVRSFASNNGGHTYDSVTTGGNAAKAAVSAVYSHMAGSTHPHTGLPTNVLVLPEAVQDGLKLGSNFETGALPSLTQPGILGPSCEAFSPAGGSQLKKSMTLTMPREKFDDRRELLGQLDALRRDADHRGTLARADKFQQQAFDVITQGVTSAFDLSKEDPKTVERYDTSKMFKIEEPTKWYDMKRASNLLGRQMLLARRLCEAGCGFVTVSDCGWDMHANENSPKNMAGLKWLAPQVDHAVAAFLDDVNARGLSDRILLVLTGEMGRSPRLNKNGGRDHHGGLTPLILAGGGLKAGQVVGKSDATANRPATRTYTPANLFATILHFLFDLTKLRLRTDVHKDVKATIENHSVIEEVF